jgi:hypothetical protein
VGIKRIHKFLKNVDVNHVYLYIVGNSNKDITDSSLILNKYVCAHRCECSTSVNDVTSSAFIKLTKLFLNEHFICTIEYVIQFVKLCIQVVHARLSLVVDVFDLRLMCESALYGDAI